MAEASDSTDSNVGHSLVQDMMESGIIVKSPDKPKPSHGKGHKGVSEADRAMITHMVKGLSKFKEYEEDIDETGELVTEKLAPTKSVKSQGTKQKKEDKVATSSLSDYVNAEMSVLTAELSVQTKHKEPVCSTANKDTNSKSQETASSKKTGARIGSVSDEMQKEFLSLQVEQEIKIKQQSHAEQLHDFVKDTTDEKQKQMPTPAETGVKDSQAETIIEKKGKKKKKDKKGRTTPEKEAIGSYTQLLMSMGHSPNRKKQSEHDTDNYNQLLEPGVSEVTKHDDSQDGTTNTSQGKHENEEFGRKRKHDKKKGADKQAAVVVATKEQIQPQVPESKCKQSQERVKAHVAEKYKHQDSKASSKADSDSPENMGKKKKKEKSPLPQSQPSPAPVEVERPSSSTGGNKQKNKKKGKQNQNQESSTSSQPQTQRLPTVHVAVDSSTVVEVIVPKHEHKFLIGPQNKHLQEILDITGVLINVPPYNIQSDKVTLSGDKLQLGPALALMFSKSQQAQMEAFNKGARPKTPQQGQYNQQGQGQKGKKGQQKGQVSNQQYSSNTPVEGIESLVINADQHGGRTIRGQGRDLARSDQENWRQQMGQYSGHQHGRQHEKGHKGQSQQGGHVMKGQGQMAPRNQNGAGGKGQGQGKKQKKRQNVFMEYFPEEEVSAGLKRRILVEGPIRINPKNYEEAYVPHPDGKSDILIGSFKHRNRALNGDIVAVQLMEEGEWKFNKDELKYYEEDLKQTGELAQNSDDEVVIESEEIVQIQTSNSEKPSQNSSQGGSETPKIVTVDESSNTPMQKSSAKGGNETKKKKSPVKGDNCRSPKKRYTSLNDVMGGDSMVLRKKMGTDEGQEQLKKMLQRTGRVVAVIERRHSRASTGHIKLMQDKNCGRALFSPNDHRMPRIMVPIENCPPDFLERPEDHAKTLFVGRVTDWRQDSMMADGCLAKSLGEAGEIEPETEGMLIENGIDFDDFPEEAVDCLPKQSPWRIPAEEFEYRRDLRQSCIFTIDPATARDLDDALSCEDLGDGRYKVGVHIADVSYFIDEDTVLDRVAALRATSVYLVHKVIPMLPRLLCEQLCSLNPDEDRLTFSVEWTITEDGDIEDEWFGRSVIRSCVKLAYDHAQGFIEEPDRLWTQEELPPISEGFSVDDIKTRVLNLNKLAVNLRKARMDSGALRLDQVKLQYTLDKESGMPNGYWVYRQKDSNKLVEEFMLLANMAVATRINKDFPDKAMLRRHPPPQEKMVENLRDQCSALGIHIDPSSAGSFQRSLWNYYGNDDYDLARMQVLVALCAKPMQNAKYFCTGCIDDESLYRHYALNVPLYTHFTSPIRRYPDIMVHRLLAASLNYCKETSRAPGDIHKLADHCNEKKTAAKRVGDLSCELFFAVFVKVAGPLEEKAMVMGVMDKAFDIFVLKLGVSKRVYCDKLNLKERMYKRERKVPSLLLVWNNEDGEPEIRQEITIFSVVDAVLEQGDQPLQWTAVIKRPQAAQIGSLFGPGMSFEDLPQPGLAQEENQDGTSLEQEVEESGTSPGQDVEEAETSQK